MKGSFPYPDLVLAARSQVSEARGTATLDVGASVDDAEPVFPLHFELGPMGLWKTVEKQAFAANLTPADRAAAIAEVRRENYLMLGAHVAAIDVSPDGTELGVVAFGRGRYFYEESKTARTPLDAFAARVYNDSALALHKKGEYARAAALFEKAAQARPTESLFAYNAACAWARAGDPQHAGPSLRRAVTLGGASLKARAAKDADFAGMRDADWFKSATR